MLKSIANSIVLTKTSKFKCGIKYNFHNSDYISFHEQYFKSKYEIMPNKVVMPKIHATVIWIAYVPN